MFSHRLTDDGRGGSIQAFCPIPSYSVVPINMTTAGLVSAANTRIFKVGAGGDYDITGWLAITIRPSVSNMFRYFNGDATKTHTLDGGVENIIIIDTTVTQITITGSDVRVEVEGM